MEEDILDRIVGHKPENAKQHRQVQKYVVKWEGHADDFDQDPKLLFADLPDVVNAYWKVVEREAGTALARACGPASTEGATGTNKSKSKRKRVVTAKAKEAMEQTNLNKKFKQTVDMEQGKTSDTDTDTGNYIDKEKEKQNENEKETEFQNENGSGNEKSESLLLLERLDRQDKLIADLQKQITTSQPLFHDREREKEMMAFKKNMARKVEVMWLHLIDSQLHKKMSL